MKEKLISYMEKTGVDAFFVSKRENLHYISGYTGGDSYLLITKDRQFFITDKRYTEQASIECPDYEIYIWRYDNKTVADAVAYLSEKSRVKSIAFEADKLTYLQYSEFESTIKCDLVPTTGVIEEMRAVKTSKEIECLRASCDIACRAFNHIIKDIKIGVTEKELASKLSMYMVMEGADTNPYGNILISGARTSLLHGSPSNKTIEYGDFVLMDFGCQFKGFLSDMTRTVVVGKASPKQREVYELEKKMVEMSIEKMKPGIPVTEVYEESIKAIKDTEYFQYHYPVIGHGVGLAVHENPFIGPNRLGVLKPGHIATIEPGIYIPNWGGVRIEDQILITETGNENLVTATHELIEL